MPAPDLAMHQLERIYHVVMDMSVAHQEQLVRELQTARAVAFSSSFPT